ncbi:MAG: Gfo/Idh/MocA family protein [Shinella sp.]|uniref:Gfo/Idh/MocA family protein n=1 Tax=Shinella sp. TaxID=1870904 RepID=UPI004035297A
MRLKIAILGVEHYHANFWAGAFLQRPEVEIIGVWDQAADKAAEFAGRHGIEVQDDLHRLIRKSHAVAICSATSGHLMLVEAAAALGRPVLCEKPLGIDRAQCDAIAAVVARTGIRFMQSFPKRFDPANHEIARLLQEKVLGRVTLCRVRHGHSHGLTEVFRSAWFVDPTRSGGGTLLDEGVHAADFLRWMFGEPESVFATLSSAALGLPVEDTAVATFRYADGLIAEVTTSWCFAAADTSIEIYGTEGSILLSGVDIASRPTRETDFLRVFRRGEGEGWSASDVVPSFKTGVFHEHVAWAFVDALKKGGPMPVTIEDGRKAFTMIEAAYRSAATGRVQMIGT